MSGHSRAKHLADYLVSVHSVVKPCAHCKKDFETRFGMYCSILCKGRAHQAKKKAERLVDLVCFYCGGQVPEKATKFCSNAHKNKFHKAKEWNKPIKIQINSKLTIETTKYDSIPEVIKRYQDSQKIC